MRPSRTGTLATRSESVPAARAVWHDYLELTKPKVVALIVFTAIVGTLLASPGLPPLDGHVRITVGTQAERDRLAPGFAEALASLQALAPP